jgi:hypothetical protein
MTLGSATRSIPESFDWSRSGGMPSQHPAFSRWPRGRLDEDQEYNWTRHWSAIGRSAIMPHRCSVLAQDPLLGETGCPEQAHRMRPRRARNGYTEKG